MQRARRVGVGLFVAILVCPVMSTLPSSPVAAVNEPSVAKSAPANVLAGEAIPYTIRVGNPGPDPLYNLSFRDVLAPGATYVSPSTPAAAGDPDVYTALVEFPVGSGNLVPQQTLVWANIADLQVADTFELGFNVTLDPAIYLVGATFDNTAAAYGSVNPRFVARFDPTTGAPLPIQNPAIRSAASNSTETDITAIRIEKDEPSPEGELLRGVHDFVTTYTLRVDTTGFGPVDDVVVTDMLPAQLEFLGCNDVDHSTAPEWPGGPVLGAGPPIAPCLEPIAVETVVISGAVYTRVTWNLGPLPVGTALGPEFTIQYAAGIPLFANELFTDVVPTPGSLEQGSNLDNNTGASTRELTGESSITNRATATGDYQGALFPGASATVTDDDELTRSIEDVRIVKTADTGSFQVGDTARYTIDVDTSEYVSATGITVTDGMPNGMCPVGLVPPNPNYHPADPGADCDPVAAASPDAPEIGGVPTPLAPGTSWNSPAGGFTIAFPPIDLAAGSSTAIEYSGRMLDFRTPGGPPSSGDSFTNTVDSTATTEPIPPSVGLPAGPVGGVVPGVQDESSWTLITTEHSIEKTVRPRDAGLLDPGPVSCPTTDPDDVYIDSDDVPEIDQIAKLGYRRGDIVCFRLRANFDTHANTRNPVIADFLPPGTTFVPGSVLELPDNTVDMELRDPIDPAGPKVWDVGTVTAPGERFVQPGGVFDIVIQARVLDVELSDEPIVTGNLMKMRTIDSDGRAQSYRDRVEIKIVPPPPLALTKGVASVASPTASFDPPQDGVPVREGSTVTYRVVVTNEGDPVTGSNYSARGADVWDLLPLELACADIVLGSISYSSDPDVGATCYDPGDAGYPFDPVPPDPHSVIRWDFPLDDLYSIDPVGGPGPQALTLEYQVVIPSPMSVSQRLDNTAGVYQYATYNNVFGEFVEFYPEDNIGESEVPTAGNRAPAADDPSHVLLPSASVAKRGTTDLTPTSTPTADPNNPAGSAVPGEGITFTYHVDVPARSSVFNGVLSDALPAQLELFPPQPIAWTFYPDAASSTIGALPLDFTLSDGTLTFPPTYTNDTLTPQRFEVSLRARVRPGETTVSSATNTATFRSDLSDDDPTPVSHSATHTTPVIQPAPNLTKSNNSNPAGFASIGSVLQYTLTVSNAAGLPALFDTVVTDCIPSGLAFVAGQPGDNAPTTAPVAGTGANGCPLNTTKITFDAGTVAPGSPVLRRYSVTVSTTAVGGDVYRNAAASVGSTLPNGVNDPSLERVITNTAFNDIRVPGGTIDKTVTPTRATVGEQVTYTVQLTAPRNVNLYNFAMRDVLPAGIAAGAGSDPGTVQLASVTCTPLANPSVPVPPTTCPAPASGTQLTPSGTAPNRVIAVLIGDVLTEPYDRRYTITFTARIANAAGVVNGATVTNTASARWNTVNTADPTSSGHAWNVTGGTDTATVTVLEPNVQIAKSVVSATPQPGDTFNYTVTVTNPGANRTAAYDITVVDLVPVGVVVNTATISNGGAYDAGARTITWDGTDLPGPLCGTRTIGDVIPCVGVTSYPLTYSATLAASSTLTDTAVLTNTADVTRYEGLPAAEPDGDRRVYDGPSRTATVSPRFPQLSTTKTASGEPTYIDGAYTWAITTTNGGNGTASNVAVTDDLPPNWTYVPGSAQVTRPSGTSQIEPTTAGCAPNDICWNGLGTLTPTQQIVIVFQATPGAGVTTSPGVGSTVRHINRTSSTATDATNATGNASGTYGAGPATASTRIDAVDLVIDKRHLDTPVAGDPFNWLLDVSNASTTDTGVGPFTVTDTLPAGVDFVSATGAGWTCGHVTPTVTCTRTAGSDTLPPSGTFPTITITVEIPSTTTSGTVLSNTASVGGRTHELDPSDNTDTDPITVGTDADLDLVKGRTTDPIVAGRSITYTLDVTNFGPSVARANIVVSDPMPPQTTFVSAGGAGWICPVPVSGVLTCTRTTDLAADASASQISVTVDVASNAIGTISNTATVTSTVTPDTNTANNSSTNSGPVALSADLRIDKTSTPNPTPGSTFVYRLRVDNDGPSDAVAVQVSDALPAGLTYVSAADVRGTWTCTPSGGNTAFACDLTGDLVSGDWATVDVTVFVAADVVGAIINTATVDSTTPDPDPDNNSDDDDSSFVGAADLTIAKTGSPTAVAGTPYTWTLLVTNNGPSNSVGTVALPIVVTDVLPDGVAFDSAGGTGWVCTHDGASFGGTITCEYAATIPGLPVPPAPPVPSSAPPITIDVDILPTAGPATIINPVTVDEGVTEDPDPGNNNAEHEVVLGDVTDLTIVKTADPTTITAGETTEFTFVVTNAGPSQADAVRVVDTLPAGMTLVSVTADPLEWQCTNDAVSFTCERPVLLPGSAPDVVVVARVDSNVALGSQLVNEVEVFTTSTETNTDNNTAEASVDVEAVADLAVEKSHAIDPVVAGTTMTFAITVTNNGPSDAIADVEVVDTLPPGFLYVSHAGPWDCDAPLPPDPATGQVVTCVYVDAGVPVPLPAGVTPDDIAMTVSIDPSVVPTGGTPYVNTATVSSPTPDTDGSNDSWSDPVTVVAEADLAIVKTHPTAAVRVGDPLTFAIQVTNNGASTAADVVVSDTLPTGLTHVSHQATGWTCVVAGPAIDCALDDDLLPGQASPITVTVQVSASAYPSVANVATVDSTTPDPIPSNNTSTDPVTVPPLVDLAITKSHGGAISVGGSVAYTVTVSNNGPTSDPGPISIVDTFPNGLSPTTASGAGVDCTVDVQVVTCVSNVPLGVGSTFVVTVTANVGGAAYPSVTNVAVVTTLAEETTLANNEAVDTAPVAPLVVLELAKTLGLQLGGNAFWNFVVANQGPNPTVEPVVVTDPLPVGLSYVSAEGAGWMCAAVADTVTCTYSDAIAPGASAPVLQIQTAISAPAGSTIVNTATVAGGAPATTPAGSTAQVTTPAAGLPVTGGDPTVLVRFALVVLGCGLVLVLFTRRRRRTNAS